MISRPAYSILLFGGSLALGGLVAFGAPAEAATCEYPGLEGKVEEYYTGKLIDTHLHIPSPLDADDDNPVLWKDMSMADIACTLQYEGTTSAFSFFPVYVGSKPYSQFYLAAERAQERFPDLFVRFINPPGGTEGVPTVTANRLTKFLNARPGLFQGYGEIGLYGHDSEEVNPYKPYAKIFREIYPVVRQNKMLVYFHPGLNQIASFERVLERYPNINFIVHGEQIENEIGDLMSEYPNIYFTVNDLYGDQYLLHQGETKKSFLAATDEYGPLLEQDLATWKDVIEAHPDQFLWGTDRGGVAAWTLDKEVGLRLADYGRAFIAQLDPAAQKKFAYQNAHRLINSTKE